MWPSQTERASSRLSASPELSSSFSQDLIVICGYERNVEEARQAIQQLVSELQEMVSQDVHLDPRTHARIIGARGKAIRKLMEEFKVRADDEARAGGGSVYPDGPGQTELWFSRWTSGSRSPAPMSPTR